MPLLFWRKSLHDAQHGTTVTGAFFFFILDLCRQGDTGPHSYTGRVAVAQTTTHMKLSFLLVSLLVLQLSRLR